MEFIVFSANLLWLIASLPKWFGHLFFCHSVKNTQLGLLRKIINENENTLYGQVNEFSNKALLQNFKNLPLTDYKDYEEYIHDIQKGNNRVLTKDKVLLLEPTGGSSKGTKLIPYTRSLQKQFGKAIDAWIGNTFLFKPSVLLGKHYWSISPNTKIDHLNEDAQLKIGFAEDTEYLGLSKKLLTNILFAVPPEISKIYKIESFRYLTLLFLVKEKNLRLISIWNPTFLTVLMDKLNYYYPKIIDDIKTGQINRTINLDRPLREKLQRRLRPNPKRAKELSLINPHNKSAFLKIWPKLKLISSWTDANSSTLAKRLSEYFPGVEIEGKGLVATEGIISIPFGKHKQKALAYRSYFFEFIDTKSGLIKNAWELEKNNTYSVVLTTGGGLYRYKLYDLIKITGFIGEIPCFDFISKEDIISDIVGEKINESHVGNIFGLLEKEYKVFFSFRLLAPVANGKDFHYSLFIQPLSGESYDYYRIVTIFEGELRKNYHYQHALNLSQLKPLKLFLIEEGMESQIYLDYLIKKGLKAGNIKMCYLSPELDWDKVFIGQYYSDSR